MSYLKEIKTTIVAAGVYCASPSPRLSSYDGMYSVRIPVQSIRVSGYVGTLSQKDREEKKFERLRKAWLVDIAADSSLSRITSSHYYLRVIAMGKTAIPHILKKLRQRPEPWFVALEAISGANPAENAPPGKFRAMADAWIAWGIERGIV